MGFDVINKTKRRVPALFWPKIKERIIGKNYDLSLVFAGDNLIKRLNAVYRRKNKLTTTLSFPLSKKQGEIFISLREVEEEARKYKTNFKDRLRLIFIHSLLHLKGFEHGAKMENEEKKLLKARF